MLRKPSNEPAMNSTNGASWMPLLLLFAACSASSIEMSGFVPRAAVPAFNASLRGGFSGLHVAANPAQFKELSPTCKVPLKAPAETSTLDDDLLCNKQVELSSFLSRIAMLTMMQHFLNGLCNGRRRKWQQPTTSLHSVRTDTSRVRFPKRNEMLTFVCWHQLKFRNIVSSTNILF